MLKHNKVLTNAQAVSLVKEKCSKFEILDNPGPILQWLFKNMVYCHYVLLRFPNNYVTNIEF